MRYHDIELRCADDEDCGTMLKTRYRGHLRGRRPGESFQAFWVDCPGCLGNDFTWVGWSEIHDSGEWTTRKQDASVRKAVLVGMVMFA